MVIRFIVCARGADSTAAEFASSVPQERRRFGFVIPIFDFLASAGLLYCQPPMTTVVVHSYSATVCKPVHQQVVSYNTLDKNLVTIMNHTSSIPFALVPCEFYCRRDKCRAHLAAEQFSPLALLSLSRLNNATTTASASPTTHCLMRHSKGNASNITLRKAQSQLSVSQ